MRFLIPVLLVFGGFYMLFWNIQRWNMPTAQKVGLVALCSVVSAVATGAAVYLLITIFN